LLESISGWFLIWFDNVVVAKNLGSEAAGIYSLAFFIAKTTISLPTSAITGVTLSAFSRMQNDHSKLRHAYLESTGMIASYAIPACIGLSLIGPSLVNTIYPGRWEGLGPVLQILALYAGLGHLWILNTDAFKAIGKPEIMLKIYAPVVAIMIPIYWWTSKIGLLEFTVARSLIVLVGALPHTYYAVRYLILNKDYLIKLARAPLISSAIMALCVGTGIYFCSSVPVRGVRFLCLLSLAVGGGTIYWLAMKRFAPGFARKFISLYTRSFGAKDQHE
jgi:O-antigen/teichoic acid export membrane protein